MASMRDFLGDAVIYGVGRALKKMIGFLLLPFYARALSPEEYGILDLLNTSVFLVIVIITLGLNDAGARFFYMQETQREKGRVLFTSISIRFTLACGVSLLIASLASQISEWVFDTTEYKWVIVVSSVLVITRVLNEDQSNIYRLYRKAIPFNILVLSQALLNIGLGVWLVLFLEKGVLGVQIAGATSAFITLVAGFLYFNRKVYVFEFDKQKARALLNYGFPLIGAALLNWVQGFSDRFFLLHYSSLTEMGYYSVGNMFAQPLSVVNTAVLMSHGVLIMSLAESEKGEEKPKTKKLSNQILHAYISLAAVIVVFLSIFSVELITTVTTEEYRRGVLVVPLLGFSLVLSVLYILTGFGLDLKLRSKYYFWFMLVSASLNVGLNFVLIPLYGFVGAGFTTLLSNIVYTGLAFHFSQKVFFIPRKVHRLLAYFIVNLLLALTVPYIEILLEISVPVYLKILGMLLALALPFAFRIIEPRDIEKLRSIILSKFSAS